MYCTNCGGPIPDSAKFCPSCGNISDTKTSEKEINPMIGQMRKSPQKKPFKIKWWGWLLIVIFSAGIYNTLTGGKLYTSNSSSNKSTGRTTSSQSTTSPSIIMTRVAKDMVTDLLKSPSTADFKTVEIIEVRNDSKHYLIRLVVDAQNSFGAMIRNEFYAVLKHTSGNKYSYKENIWVMEGPLDTSEIEIFKTLNSWGK